MSFAKYAQFYKDNGFFAGSKIKATVTDNSFIGQEMVLSKGTDVIQTRTIPVSGLVEFFTDESGELTLSSDNGTSTISGSVEVTNYATYNVTLNGASSDNERKAYANDVTMNAETAVANISYTGDVSRISAVASDPSLVSLSISGNKITLRDAGNNKSGKCSITATIASTSEYDSAEVSFNVNKLTGTYGSWEDASDEMIVSMVEKADKGEIDLGDFWNVGDTRKVHLDAIEAGEVVSNQPEQDVELILLHYSANSAYYDLVTNTASGRSHPSFVVGTKNCLENTSNEKFVTVTLKRDSSVKATIYGHTGDSTLGGITSWLNNIASAMPIALRDIFKEGKVYCSPTSATTTESSGNVTTGYAKLSSKAFLPSSKELGITIPVPSSTSVLGCYNFKSDKLVPANASGRMNIGETLEYYETNGLRKNKGIATTGCDYFVRNGAVVISLYLDNLYGYAKDAIYIDKNGEAQTLNLDSSDVRNIARGISPIMFI